MALVVGGRIGLITYTLGTDPRPGRIQHNEERQLLESRLVIGDQGTSALRPTAGKGKALYWNSDRAVLQWDTGTGWEDVSTVGGGGVPLPIASAGTAAEGVSQRGARADHVHVLPLATQSAHGAMSAADKTKLDNAVVTATGSRLVMRDANGRTQFAAPIASADVATKGYVDSIVGGAAAPVVSAENNGLATPSMLFATNEVTTAASTPDPGLLVLRDAAGRAQFATPNAGDDAANKSYVDGQIGSHRHDGSHITTGTITAARLPIVSSVANGAMSTADKIKLDDATPSATNAKLVMRDSNGRAQFGTPSVAADVATKGYVDAGVGARAPLTHYHTASDITSGTMPPTRLPYASSSSDGILTTTDYTRISNHSHDASAINTGVISAARLPAASGSSSGIISSAAYDTIYNHSHSWTSISSKPSTFTPSSHTHPPSAISGSGVFDYDIVGGSNPGASTIYPGDVTQYNLNIGSNGKFFRSSSALRFKANVEEWEPDPRRLLDVVSVEYNQRRDDGTVSPTRHLGVIADWNVDTIPELVIYGPDTPGDGEDKIQDWDYIRWTAAHQVLHRWTAKRDDHQDRRLARIEEALGLAPLED